MHPSTPFVFLAGLSLGLLRAPTSVSPSAAPPEPANDDATKSIQLLTDQITNAIIEGVEKRGSEEPQKKDEQVAPTAKEKASAE